LASCSSLYSVLILGKTTFERYTLWHSASGRRASPCSSKFKGILIQVNSMVYLSFKLIIFKAAFSFGLNLVFIHFWTFLLLASFLWMNCSSFPFSFTKNTKLNLPVFSIDNKSCDWPITNLPESNTSYVYIFWPYSPTIHVPICMQWQRKFNFYSWSVILLLYCLWCCSELDLLSVLFWHFLSALKAWMWFSVGHLITLNTLALDKTQSCHCALWLHMTACHGTQEISSNRYDTMNI